MKTVSRILVALVAVICFASTASANLVLNPGFETGDFTFWTQSGNTSNTGVVGGAEHSGNYGAFFSPNLSPGFISQDLTTIAGATYDLTFWLRNDNSTPPNHFEASWDGNIIAASVLNDASASSYTQYTFTGLLATGASTALQFGFRHDTQLGWSFDDVSVELSADNNQAVPEAFSTLWLALPLVGMLGFARLRRREA